MKSVSAGMRFARYVAAPAAAFAFAVILHCPARAAGTAETAVISRVKEKSLHFGRMLDEAVAGKAYASGEAQAALLRLEDWVSSNKYPRIKEFLDALDADSAGILYEAFRSGGKYLSSEELPIFEDPYQAEQAAVLSLPFRGEAVALAEAGGSATNTWMFTPTGSTLGGGAGGKGKEISFTALMPAPGWVTSSGSAIGPLAAKCPGAGIVSISHDIGEASVFTCITPIARFRDNAARGQAAGGAVRTDKGFLFRYNFTNSGRRKTAERTAKFAAYFARAEGEGAYRLVLSGYPKPGELLIDIESYMKLSAR